MHLVTTLTLLLGIEALEGLTHRIAIRRREHVLNNDESLVVQFLFLSWGERRGADTDLSQSLFRIHRPFLQPARALPPARSWYLISRNDVGGSNPDCVLMRLAHAPAGDGVENEEIVLR